MLIIKYVTVYFPLLCACCKLIVCLLVLLQSPVCLGWSLLAAGQAHTGTRGSEATLNQNQPETALRKNPWWIFLILFEWWNEMKQWCKILNRYVHGEHPLTRSHIFKMLFILCLTRKVEREKGENKKRFVFVKIRAETENLSWSDLRVINTFLVHHGCVLSAAPEV